MKFAQFNQEVNLSDGKTYTVETSTGKAKGITFAEAKAIANGDPKSIIYWIIPKGYVAMKTEINQSILNALYKFDTNILAFTLAGNMWIIAKSNFTKTTTNNMLACGLGADIFCFSKSGTEIMLPFHSPASQIPVLRSSAFLHERRIGDLPLWLQPLNKESSPTKIGLQLPIQNNTQTVMRDHLKNLRKFTSSQIVNILTIVNEEFSDIPMTKEELNQMASNLQSQMLARYMDKNEFFHDLLGNDVIDLLNIKKDVVSKKLFFYDEKKHIYVCDEDYLKGYLTRMCPRLKEYQKDETIKYILNYLYEDAVEFNKNEYSIVFRNGIYDLSTNEFREMSPDDLESIMIDANYNPDAYSKTADEFFATATCGDKDTEKLLYECIGYTMLKTNELAKWFILIGNGRNGKSTFYDIVKTILGRSNYSSLSFKDLASNFRVSALVGKLASIAGDISAQPIQESDLLKSITAYEDITIEEKYKQAYTDKVFSTMLFGANKLPSTPDTSDGFYRRAVIIPFNANLSKISNVDGIRFKRELLKQESIDYIAYKATKAIFDVLNNTKEFTVPMASKNALEEYKTNQSSILSWIKEEMHGNKDAIKVKSKGRLTNAYQSYKDWCDSCERKPYSKTNFKQMLKDELGIEFDTN